MQSADIEWVSVTELARRLGVSNESVYRLARANTLPGMVRLGRRVIINYGAFVEASKEPITPAA